MKVPAHANVTCYDIIIYVRVYRSISFSRIALYTLGKFNEIK